MKNNCFPNWAFGSSMDGRLLPLAGSPVKPAAFTRARRAAPSTVLPTVEPFSSTLQAASHNKAQGIHNLVKLWQAVRGGIVLDVSMVRVIIFSSMSKKCMIHEQTLLNPFSSGRDTLVAFFVNIHIQHSSHAQPYPPLSSLARGKGKRQDLTPYPTRTVPGPRPLTPRNYAGSVLSVTASVCLESASAFASTTLSISACGDSSITPDGLVKRSFMV